MPTKLIGAWDCALRRLPSAWDQQIYGMSDWRKDDSARCAVHVLRRLQTGRHPEHSSPDAGGDASKMSVMERFPVHVDVGNLADSARYHSALFAAEPPALKPDYTKWMLEDPRANFALSERGPTPGIEHLGFQAEDHSEPEERCARDLSVPSGLCSRKAIGPAATPRARRLGSSFGRLSRRGHC